MLQVNSLPNSISFAASVCLFKVLCLSRYLSYIQSSVRLPIIRRMQRALQSMHKDSYVDNSSRENAVVPVVEPWQTIHRAQRDVDHQKKSDEYPGYNSERR